MNTQSPPSPAGNADPAADEQAPLIMKKVTAATAQEIVRHFELSSDSQPLLSDTHTPGEFLQILMNQRHYHDAVTFLSHAIPAREAVWWACLCAGEHRDNSDEPYRQAHAAADAWIRNPTEENRRSAEKKAQESDYKSAASWTAAAAFWSGGSIAPADQPVMEPPAYLYAHAVSGAIVMSAGHGMPAEKEVEVRYQNYLRHGIDIANGDKG